ncbi:hypothetical protein V6R21_24985 [Limibacter armeniacum]|uniref:hypothetical protein n=1 Tax=Limibacter armeniacum TaxID=466084 RepID=UPI002FE57843
MKVFNRILFAILLTTGFISCSEEEGVNTADGKHEYLIVSNITTTSNVNSYLGTFKDLTVGSYTNANAYQTTSYPFVSIFGDDVFVTQNREGDQVIKYTRTEDGNLVESGRITMPADSQPMHVLVENSSRAFCSLYNTGQIAVLDPSSMTLTETIDLSSFAKGDGSPDPNVMLLHNNLLYVAVSQTTDTFTSTNPAEILVIDLSNNNTVTSITDDRASFAGSVETPGSLFMDEKGDIYIYCVSSYGFGPGQKAGFLRIKSGELAFDDSYFFNTTDFLIEGIEGNHVDYLYRPTYAGNGMLYSSGNVYALASNPPDYINDRTFGSFKLDLYNQTIEVLDLPFSNSYAASPLVTDTEILFGISGNDGVGIYTYDPNAEEGPSAPIITTQGDPGIILKF